MSDLPRTRVLTGIKPSLCIHLGHFFGAIRDLVDPPEGAELPESFFLVADYHALARGWKTDVVDDLDTRALELARTLLACGVDPERDTLYRQSDVPETYELSTLLANVTPFGLLFRALAFKEAREHDMHANVGLFNYPLLMAADILGIQAQEVLAGRDQNQNLEIARDIARKCNGGGVVPALHEPVPRRTREPFVPGTDGGKMSFRYGNHISLIGSDDEIRKAVNDIKTAPRAAHAPKIPEQEVTYALYRLVAPAAECDGFRQRYASGELSDGQAKAELVDAMMEFVRPMRRRFESLELDAVRDALAAGAVRAREVVRDTLGRVRGALSVRSAR